ncbi:tubulin--tyrosine ligase-like protein 12 isoform X2 [Lepidochelys kempii]|uniref:tubulin--tyrosine ligase-like protein 12 isoform X2 n=1 Tax=Lepidochelys kempii TaxID=8472 RepID=UPI003C6FFD14
MAGRRPRGGGGGMAGERPEEHRAFVALHGAALGASGVPPLYWERLRHKLENEVFDAGEFFGIMQVEEVEEEEDDNEEIEGELKKKPNPGNELCYKVIVTNENGLQAANPNSIFLIDHAWTYRVEHARQQLLHVPGLLHRMANLMGIDFHGEVADEGAIEQVLQEMWKYNQTYQLSQGTAEEKVPVWYIMDEFGSRIQHSDEPTFATAPLFYIPQQIAYTVLWPLRDLETGEEVTRDYAYGETDRLIRKCMLLPWAPTEVLDVNYSTPEPSEDHYQAILNKNKEKLPVAINPPVYDKNKIFKVYTDLPQILNNLKHPRFEFTEDEGEADILYNFSHFKDYRGEDNHWICKPWNLARSLDTHITNNLHNIIRHRESSPKVVSKYIESPVLFHREDVGMVKFDIRYVVLLRSIKPLKLYAYDVFWLRFSNRAFSLDDLDDYEKHFTVMNYASGVTLKQVHYDEFIPLFEKQYPEYSWKTVQAEIFKAFAELFQAASAKPAPFGICDYPSSRAVYAIDLMLKWDTTRDGKRTMQPQVLEVNFNPDCDRACKYHPTFFNDVFSTLFLDETNNCHVTYIV